MHESIYRGTLGHFYGQKLNQDGDLGSFDQNFYDVSAFSEQHFPQALAFSAECAKETKDMCDENNMLACNKKNGDELILKGTKHRAFPE